LFYKRIEFKNAVGQKVKVTEIPVLGSNDRYYFMIQARLQLFISSLYNNPQEKSSYSFREYLKRKIRWSDFEDLFHDYTKTNS
jgi:predicted GTPase